MLIIKNSLLLLLLVPVFAFFLAPPPVNAQSPPEPGLDDALERRAQEIDRMIMCPVCPAETIDQAQVEISFQMRVIVREMLAEGKTREEVLDYFADRYGPDILAAPPKSGVNLLAWILPIAGVAAGLGGVFLVLRAMTGRVRPAAAPSTSGHSPAVLPTADDPEMSPYLEIADRLILARRNSRSGDARPVVSSGQDSSGQDSSGGDFSGEEAEKGCERRPSDAARTAGDSTGEGAGNG